VLEEFFFVIHSDALQCNAKCGADLIISVLFENGIERDKILVFNVVYKRKPKDRQ
jgi:hypothetical protein